MPDWGREIRTRIASLGLDPAREAELVEELSADLEDHYQDSRAGGASPEEARRVALLELEEPEKLAQGLTTLRQARRARATPLGAPPQRLLGDLGQDLRYAARALRNSPGFTAMAVLTLALGIGANSAIFSLVSATLLQRLPVHDPERLVHVMYHPSGVFSYPEIAELRVQPGVFEGFAAWGGITASLNSDGETDLVGGAIVTGSYFDVLGVKPRLGRLFSPSDDETPGAHPVAVLSHTLWQTRFGGRLDVVGREVLLNGHRFSVLGVTPEGFGGAQLGVQRGLYVPMMMQAIMRPPRAGYSGDMNPDLLKTRGNRWLTGLGRLKSGVSEEQARAALTTYALGVFPPRPAGAPPLRIATVPVNVGDVAMRAQLTSVARLLLAVVGAVLVLACANVANLMLTRASARRREIAVRLALGASRWRLVRQLLTESVLVACGGGLAGLFLAYWIMAAFRGAPPPDGAIPIAIDATIDGPVLAFTLALSLVVGVAFGLAPALSASRPALVPSLKDESFVPDARARWLNLRNALVVSQVGLSLTLLVAAGLFLRNLTARQSVSPGFDAPRLLAAQLPVNLLRYTKAQGREFYRAVTEKVEALPGVESASVARVPMLAGGGRSTSLHVEGRTGPADRFQNEGGGFGANTRDSVGVNVVSPKFFRTLGVPLLAGRDFDAQDAPEAPPVVMVNDAFRRVHFADKPRQDVLGLRVSVSGPEGPWRQIVGVVADSKYRSLTEEPTTMLYLPLSQNHETGVVLYVRTAGDPQAFVPAVRREVQTLEPNLPLPDLRTLEETVASSLYVARMGAWLLAAFASLALLLAAVGVYGVTSFTIGQRTREIGVRMALGARAHDVLALVMKDGMRLVACGLGLGLLLALAASRSLESFLFGVSGRDGATFLAVPLILAAVAIFACLVPARRATRLDPVEALRQR